MSRKVVCYSEVPNLTLYCVYNIIIWQHQSGARDLSAVRKVVCIPTATEISTLNSVKTGSDDSYMTDVGFVVLLMATPPLPGICKTNI